MPLTFGLLLLVVSALAQVTVLGRVAAGGPRADLVLLVVLAWSMLRGMAEGTICGIVGGLLLDLLSEGPFGLYAALLGATAACTALGEANLYRGNVPLFLATAALATVVLHGGAVLGLQLAQQQPPGLLRVVQFVVPTLVLNAILMPIAFNLIQRSIRVLSGWRQLEL